MSVVKVMRAASLPCVRPWAPAVAHVRIGLGILAIEVALRLALSSRLVDLTSIIALALVRIADDIVGSIDLLEVLVRLRLARIEIGMRLLGRLAVSRADIVLAGVGSHAQRLVWIGHASHGWFRVRRSCAPKARPDYATQHFSINDARA